MSNILNYKSFEKAGVSENNLYRQSVVKRGYAEDLEADESFYESDNPYDRG